MFFSFGVGRKWKLALNQAAYSTEDIRGQPEQRWPNVFLMSVALGALGAPATATTESRGIVNSISQLGSSGVRSNLSRVGP